MSLMNITKEKLFFQFVKDDRRRIYSSFLETYFKCNFWLLADRVRAVDQTRLTQQKILDKVFCQALLTRLKPELKEYAFKICLKVAKS